MIEIVGLFILSFVALALFAGSQAKGESEDGPHGRKHSHHFHLLGGGS